MNKIFFVALMFTISLVSAKSLYKDHEIITKAETTRQILDTMMSTVKTKELFKVWHYLFKPDYVLNSVEAVSKYKIFKDNLKYINEINAENLPYTLGLNKFSDLTLEEYRKLLTKKLFTQEQYDELDRLISGEPIFLKEQKSPLDLYEDEDEVVEEDDEERENQQLNFKEVDHRSSFGAPRDQGNCGSCWAFATTGAVEGSYNKAFADKRLDDYLSPQQLVDCDLENYGCDGGAVLQALNYIVSNGVSYEKDYQYKEEQQECNKNRAPSPVVTETIGIKYCSNYERKNKCTRKKVNNLLVQGPLVVGIDAGTRAFQSYSKGIFTATCSEDNHAVILVGFANKSKSSKSHLLVRNSWGATWGENGYIRVGINAKNKNSCFVENEGILTLVKTN
jgi:C1A family cysteine protease